MGTRRLFIALPLPAPVRDVLAALVQPLPGVNWTRPDQLPLTLRFLGDVPEEKLERITAQLGTVRVEPFILPLEGIGTFPPQSPPRVAWLGVGRGHPRLHQLRQRVDDALLAAGLLALDVRTFQPHVTLARCTDGAAPAFARWLHTQREFAAPPFRVASFDLCASELRPTGAVHEVVQSFPLVN
jgi:RNA 2',3'-cyclic 3'-phosphodiesterase